MSNLRDFVDYGFSNIDDKQGKELVISVQKESPEQKLGISLLVGAGRLYVHFISPTSLFAKTDLRVNDLVESINGINFVDNPDLQEALSLVQAASSTVTLVVKRYPQ